MRALFTISFFISCISVVSCNSSREETLKDDLFAQEQDKMVSLTGEKMKEWKVESYVLNGVDVLSGLDACKADNLDIYFADHRFESVEGSKKCNEADPYITETGHWHFNGDSSEIEVSISKDFYILRLIEISPTKLHYLSCNHKDTVEAVLRPTNSQ